MTRPLQLISTIFLLTISFQPFAQKSKATEIDTSIYSQQIVTIQGKKYNGFLTSDGFRLLNSRNQIYLKHSGDYFTWEFKDFNKDGFGDIYLDKGGNTPERFDLLLFLPKTKSFRQVKDFENFPAPENISGTKYFYSYHKSGCVGSPFLVHLKSRISFACCSCFVVTIQQRLNGTLSLILNK